MFERDYTASRTRAQDSGLLLARVSFLTVGAVICTAIGAQVSAAQPVLMLPALVGMFVMLFVCRAVAEKFPWNIAALAVFAGLEGMVMGPALVRYAAVNGPGIIVQAAALTVVIFGVVGLLGYTSTRSYAHWLPWMLGALLLLLVGGIVLWFVSSPMMSWLYAAGGAALFIAFTFADFTRIRHEYGPDDYAHATLEIYLDLINLFWFILRLLGGRGRN